MCPIVGLGLMAYGRARSCGPQHWGIRTSLAAYPSFHFKRITSVPKKKSRLQLGLYPSLA